jgi:hypothetical protein
MKMVNGSMVCSFCNKELFENEQIICYYCKKVVCSEHRFGLKHNCPKVLAANESKNHMKRSYFVGNLFGILSYIMMIAGGFILMMNIPTESGKIADVFPNYLIFSLIIGIPLIIAGFLILHYRAPKGFGDNFNPEHGMGAGA